MKKSRRRSILFVSFLVALICFSGVYLVTEVAPVGTAYAAKRLCSGVFLSGRAPSSILAEELKPYGFISTTVDYDRKTVTCSLMGLAVRTAVFRDGLGSTLALGMSEEELRRQALGFDPSRPDRKALQWPDGDQVNKEPLPAYIDAAQLNRAVDRAFEETDRKLPKRTRAVVVVQEGRIIAERYAPGFTRDTPQLGWSMSKSVTGALAGILVMQGRLNLHGPAEVPEWKKPGDPRAAITLDQLMRMSSGLKFSENYENPTSDVVHMLFAEGNTGAYAASKPLETPPDTRWHYSTGTTNIICRLISHAAGAPLADFFSFPRRALFDRIGMTSALIEPDTSGTFVGSSFMYATPRDWARFGLLCLNDGVWNNERILPGGWIRYCTTPTTGAPKGKYGAQFWLNAGSPGKPEDRWMPKVPADMYTLRGFEGQYVAVIPSKKLVAVRLGLSVKEESWDEEVFLADILASFKPSAN